MKLPDQTFAVVVSNFRADLGFELPEKTVREALQGTFAVEDIAIKLLTVGPRKATLRFDTTNAEELEKIVQSLQSVRNLSPLLWHEIN